MDLLGFLDDMDCMCVRCGWYALLKSAGATVPCWLVPLCCIGEYGECGASISLLCSTDFLPDDERGLLPERSLIVRVRLGTE